MNTWRIVVGDALERLRELDAGSVQTCVTSPPYFGLRDYGTGSWEGGDEGCDHVKRPPRWDETPRPTAGPDRGGAQTQGMFAQEFRDTCGKCGASRTDSQLGLEATPDEYVARLVEVFREVRRVLRDDGTLWLNLGDSYAGGKQGRDDADRDLGGGGNHLGSGNPGGGIGRPVPAGYKQKDLLGIPWMVAFALRADGWYLRSDIIWAKPNPMPESVTDRPTKSHEFVFLLSKSPRYFYDADAVREDAEKPDYPRTYRLDNGSRSGFDSQEQHNQCGTNPAGRNKRSVWTVATAPFPGAHFAVFPPKLIEPCVLAGSAEDACGVCGAPWERVVRRQSVLRDTHLERERIRNVGGRKDGYTQLPAGGVVDSESETLGWRPSCSCNEKPARPLGSPTEIVQGRSGLDVSRHDVNTNVKPCPGCGGTGGTVDPPDEFGNQHAHHDCETCQGDGVMPAPTGTSTVLDPFAGAGTTGLVATRLGRSFIGIELNPEYAEMARERIRDDAPLMNYLIEGAV